MRNISAWAIRNPVIPLVMFVFLLAMGALAFSRMDVNLNPDITAPAATVSISPPGAAPPAPPLRLPARHGRAGIQSDGREPQSGHYRSGRDGLNQPAGRFAAGAREPGSPPRGRR